MRTEIIIEQEDVIKQINNGQFGVDDIVHFMRVYIKRHNEENHSSSIGDLLEQLNKMLHAEWHDSYGSLTNLYQIAQVEDNPL